MKKILTLIAITLVFTSLSACSKKIVSSETAAGKAPTSQPVTESSDGAKPEEIPTAGIPSESAPSEKELSAQTAKSEAVVPEVKGLQDIFFDFDRFTIREDARPLLEENAKYLKANQNIHIVIEGHCDERGTSEYNIALGERRAQSAKKYLTDLGIDASRISVISYGKERPFCADHNEQCWQENRRAHFVAK